MPKIKIFIAVIVLALVGLACNTLLPTSEPPPPTSIIEFETVIPTTAPSLPLTEDDVPRVTLEEAVTAYAAGAAVIVDVRDVNSFLLSHIAGAVSVPLDAIETDPVRLSLDKEEWIITYCT